MSLPGPSSSPSEFDKVKVFEAPLNRSSDTRLQKEIALLQPELRGDGKMVFHFTPMKNGEYLLQYVRSGRINEGTPQRVVCGMENVKGEH